MIADVYGFGPMRSSTLVQALSAGRAVLVLGQRHSPGLLDGLRLDVAAITGQTDSADLVRLLAAVTDDSSLEGLRRAFERRPVTPELLAIAENPWAYVLTSAIDPQVHEAFQRAGAAGRQLRVLFGGHVGTLARSGQGVLTLLRLFGALEERERAYRPPTSALELRRRTRLELPLVLTELPVLIGPGGHLVVVGVGSDDWLDVEALALSCTDLPEGSVHWFLTAEQPVPPEELEELFGNRLRLYSRALTAELGATSTDDERDALSRAREHAIHPASRHITVRRGGSTTTIAISPQEWRRLSQVALVLDDEITQKPSPLSQEEERQAFRDFLYRVQRVPDWGGVARGFLFEREVGQAFLGLISRELAAPRSVHASDAVHAKVTMRSSHLPILVEGPPASGKTRLLHWLAYQLRLHGHVVVYILPTRGRTAFEQIERVCRLLEEKTQSSCAVIVDNLDEDDYEHLSELLASSGRRSVLIGAISSLPTSPNGDDGDPGARYSRKVSYRAFPLASWLTEAEADRFLNFLAERRFPDLQLARAIVRERFFLLLLYRLLPDSRGNIYLAVGQEYERLVNALERHLEVGAAEDAEPIADWQRQLAAASAMLFPDLEQIDLPVKASPFHHDPSVVSAILLALFCSQIERPLSLDLLLRTQGSLFLRSYQAFSRAVEQTALLQESVLDGEGTIGVEAEHAFVAKVALRTLLPDRPAQLDLISTLIKSVRWDETALPGENPDQDYVVSVLQAVGPRGASGDEFASPASLEQLAEVLAEVRLVHGARLPQLLLLEANTLRLLANVATSAFDDSVARCRQAIDILFDAEQLLGTRRPSASRNAQLQNVLTTRAVVHGFVSGACLREYMNADPERRSTLRATLREHLDEVNRDTVRARSIGRASYFPLDVSFWAHRDQLEQLPDLSDEERVSLLGALESVLDIAAEEPIETGQYVRYRRRVADLAQLQGDTELVESVAAELRAKGDFSSDAILARRKAIDPITRAIRSLQEAREALDDLLALAPAIFRSEQALALMHHLWLAVHLGGQVISGEQPVRARCTRDDWSTWRRILEGRLALPANEANPYLNFCLAWTLLSLDEALGGIQILRANEALAIGNRRRVGTLAVLTDEAGATVEYAGTVRRIDGQQVILYVPRLLSEIRAPARVQAELAVSVRVGDEWRFGLGLNYQGVLPVPLRS